MQMTPLNTSTDRDTAQMLLATGVVLLMSLLSMAIFGVKVAGLTLPHDTASDGVIITAQEVSEGLPELVEARTQLWIDGGLEPLDAGQTAMDGVHNDMLHHGEVRGIEVKMIDIQVTEASSTTLRITGELGVSDGDAMLTIPLDFTITHE
ncbi:MAG: hypothetical protein QF699_03845 [Candidatus Poseidoniaceae archaeon]|jgi:hypothetical protein|nr:hypothetical protein [Candidatus Poseidoniaceae archaeon]MDP6362287.1 hypothetical protein [Candidatus Poseidoniaceae archaeon]|tara:strand:+ start:281 stop:730 length:450 start_codon:yes stop_codon:yes gene_type:complete